jgi:hypothetical protein
VEQRHVPLRRRAFLEELERHEPSWRRLPRRRRRAPSPTACCASRRAAFERCRSMSDRPRGAGAHAIARRGAGALPLVGHRLVGRAVGPRPRKTTTATTSTATCSCTTFQLLRPLRQAPRGRHRPRGHGRRRHARRACWSPARRDAARARGGRAAEGRGRTEHKTHRLVHRPWGATRTSTRATASA